MQKQSLMAQGSIWILASTDKNTVKSLNIIFSLTCLLVFGGFSSIPYTIYNIVLLVSCRVIYASIKGSLMPIWIAICPSNGIVISNSAQDSEVCPRFSPEADK